MTTSTSARGAQWTVGGIHIGVDLAIVPSVIPPLPVLNQNFTGTAGNDTFNGTANADTFNLTQGGNDTANGNGGKDTFNLGGAFTAQDKLNGGDGNDTLELDGNYGAGIVFGAQTLVDVETIKLKAGHNYNLTAHDATVAAGEALSIDAGALGAGNTLTFIGSAELDAKFNITGGAGNDNLTGGRRGDTFDLTKGGNEDVHGGNGNDLFYLGATFTAADRIDGGNGLSGVFPYGNVIYLDGDYSAGLTLGAATIVNVDTIQVTAGHSYTLIMNDGNVTAGLTIEGGGLQAGESLTVDGSAETDSGFVFNGGAGQDFFLGGANRDVVQLGTGSGDVCRSGGGNDTFTLGTGFDKGDRLDGGSGYDDILLHGDYTAGVTLKDNTMKNIEEIRVGNIAGGYKLGIVDANVAAGENLFINGSLLDATRTLNFDGSNETDGSLVITGGAGADTLRGGGIECTVTGGAGDDNLFAGSVASTLTGGAGRDTLNADFLSDDVFVFNAVSESTSTGYDTAKGMNFAEDQFDMSVEVTAVEDEIIGGRLRANNFDADLADAVQGNAMNAGHAVLFAPNQGTFAHFVFLVVDANGVDGYQAGEDYVIRIMNDNGTLTIDNFGPA